MTNRLRCHVTPAQSRPPLTKVADDKVFTDELEARGIVHVAGGVQIVYGMMAANYATQMREALGME